MSLKEKVNNKYERLSFNITFKSIVCVLGVGVGGGACARYVRGGGGMIKCPYFILSLVSVIQAQFQYKEF